MAIAVDKHLVAADLTDGAKSLVAKKLIWRVYKKYWILMAALPGHSVLIFLNDVTSYWYTQFLSFFLFFKHSQDDDSRAWNCDSEFLPGFSFFF